MRNRFRVFLAFMLIVGITTCFFSCRSGQPESAQPSVLPGDSAKTPPADGRYTDYIFENVTVEKDIPYGQAADYLGQEQTLLLDIYTPEDDTEDDRPAILFVHGGGFTGGDKDGGVGGTLCEAFARKGYVCLSINYRLRNETSDWNGTITDAVTDTYTALTWIIAHSDDYEIDPGHIALSGYSAGAITVTALAYHGEIDPSDGAAKSIFGIVNMAGGSYGMGDIRPGAPPCLIIHGSEDDTVPFMGGTQCSETLTAAGVKNTFYVMDGISHDLYPHLQEIEDVATIFLYEELTGIKPDIPIRK